VGIDDAGVDALLQLGPTDPRPWRWYDLLAFVGDEAAGREPGRWPPRWTLRTPSALQPALDDIWRVFETQADPSMRAVEDPAAHARWLLSRAADGSRPAPVIAALLLLSYRTTAAAQVLWLGRSVPLRAREIGIAPIQGYDPPVPGPLVEAVKGARHRGLLTAMFPSRWKLWQARRPTRPFPASARVLLQVAEQWTRFDPELPDDAHLITTDGGSALQYLGGNVMRTLMATTIGYPPFGAPPSEVPLRINELDLLPGSRYVIHIEKVHLLNLEDEAEAKALRDCVLETTDVWHDPKRPAPWRLQWLLTCRPAHEERVRKHLDQLGIPYETWPGRPSLAAGLPPSQHSP